MNKFMFIFALFVSSAYAEQEQINIQSLQNVDSATIDLVAKDNDGKIIEKKQKTLENPEFGFSKNEKIDIQEYNIFGRQLDRVVTEFRIQYPKFSDKDISHTDWSEPFGYVLGRMPKNERASAIALVKSLQIKDAAAHASLQMRLAKSINKVRSRADTNKINDSTSLRGYNDKLAITSSKEIFDGSIETLQLLKSNCSDNTDPVFSDEDGNIIIQTDCMSDNEALIANIRAFNEKQNHDYGMIVTNEEKDLAQKNIQNFLFKYRNKNGKVE